MSRADPLEPVDELHRAEHFERRRRLADATIRMRSGEVICEEDAVAQFVEGTAVLGGAQVSWQTVGLSHRPRSQVDP